MVTPAVGAGPFNIVVPAVSFVNHVSPVDEVLIGDGGLAIGSLRVAPRPAVEWNPRPPWEVIRALPDRQRAAGPLLSAALREYAPPGSLAGLIVDLPAAPSLVERAFQQAARAAIGELGVGLRTDDESRCLSAVTGLAGLGLGLTPAGDDWLVGWMLAGWAGLLPIGARTMLHHCLVAAADLTNPLSAAWLRAAAEGQCSVRWHRLFETIQAGDRAAITATACDLIVQGHTSGADALAGYLAGLPGLLPSAV